MQIEEPLEPCYPYMASDEDAGDDDYSDEAADEQSEEHDDRGSDPEP